MSRNLTINYEEVAQAVKKIESQGENPTILRVREELGNHGSTTVISKFVKQYKESRGDAKPARPMPSVQATEIENPEHATQENSVQESKHPEQRRQEPRMREPRRQEPRHSESRHSESRHQEPGHQEAVNQDSAEMPSHSQGSSQQHHSHNHPRRQHSNTQRPPRHPQNREQNLPSVGDLPECAENTEVQPRVNSDQSLQGQSQQGQQQGHQQGHQQGQAPRRSNNQDPRRQKNRNQNNSNPRHQNQNPNQGQNQGYRDHHFKDRRPQPQQGKKTLLREQASLIKPVVAPRICKFKVGLH